MQSAREALTQALGDSQVTDDLVREVAQRADLDGTDAETAMWEHLLEVEPAPEPEEMVGDNDDDEEEEDPDWSWLSLELDDEAVDEPSDDGESERRMMHVLEVRGVLEMLRDEDRELVEATFGINRPEETLLQAIAAGRTVQRLPTVMQTLRRELAPRAGRTT